MSITSVENGLNDLGISVTKLQAAASGATAANIPSADTAVAGTVLKGAAVANVTPAADGTAVGTAFNALLASLRAAGVITT